VKREQVHVTLDYCSGFSVLFAATRPFSSLVPGALAASAAIAGYGGFSFRALAAGLAMLALAGFGFAVNDIFDYEKDRAAGVRRPIAECALSRTGAARLAAALLVAGSAAAAFAGAGGAIYAATALLLLLYSPVARRLPLFKDAYIAVLCCAPLHYGALAGGGSYSWRAYAVLACFVLGREVLMDADELPGDSRAGIRTVAAVLGRNRTWRFGAALMLAAAGALIVVVEGRAEVLGAAATLSALGFLFLWPGLGWSKRIQWSRLPMLAGAVALAYGGR
jgi:4-hydroxybenzoate polyprenyltransferase